MSVPRPCLTQEEALARAGGPSTGSSGVPSIQEETSEQWTRHT